jgi:hypothetical protein
MNVTECDDVDMITPEDEEDFSQSDHFNNIDVVTREVSQSLQNYVLNPLQEIITGYLFNIVLLKSTKDPKKKAIACYVPYLKFQSKTMEMKLESNEFYYYFDYSYDLIQYMVQYVHSHGMKHVPNIEKPLRSNKISDNTDCAFDACFIDNIGPTNTELFYFCNFITLLNIDSLLHLTCAKLASLTKGKPIEQCKQILHESSPIQGYVPNKQMPKCNCGRHSIL